MRKLYSFTFITLDGYYKGANEDISWHKHGKEENEYASDSLDSGQTILLFGRTTYEMMAGYWPTPFAAENDPVVAKGMNEAEKIVFSRTLKEADWANTTIVKDNIVETIRKLKQTPGFDMTLLGSGSILTQLSEHNLIDEYQIMLDPVIIGDGASIFKNIKTKPELTLTKTKVFKSGVILLCYQPSK